jgi:hypothetical protein
MLTHQAPAPQPATRPPVRIGVGIDTSRYGHYAAFLREDHQPAADELPFTESADGYAQLRQRLEHLAARHGPVAFLVRLDAAGQYADHLLHALQQLARHPEKQTCAIPKCDITVSCGDPQRNKNYRAALFGSKKSDPVEARAAARFTLSERPAPARPLSVQLRTLRQVAARLQATVRQRTRLVNQLHHLLALTFPELGLLIKDVALGWVLELVHRYPTAPLLAAAADPDLAAIPYLPDRHVARLRALARSSVASLAGPAAVSRTQSVYGRHRDFRKK